MASNHSQYGDIKIGVLSFDSKVDTLVKWQPLANYLGQAIPEKNFEIVPLYYTEFEEVLDSHAIDYVLTNPAHFIAMGQSYDLSGAIATLTGLSNGEPQSGFGGVIFTKNTEDAPSSLEDLKGMRISAVSTSSLGGYQASAYELYKAEISLDTIEFVLTGMPHKNTIEMVLSDEADAGFVRSGVIEGLIRDNMLDSDALKIINPQTVDGFSQRVSTPLYPEWPFIAMGHIDPLDAQEVAAALFLLHDYPGYTERIGISGFTIPASYLPVEEMMRVLKVSPFDSDVQVGLDELWDQYSFQIILGLTMIIILCFYAITKNVTGRILRQKNEELNHLTNELQKLNEELHKLAIIDPLTGLYNRRHFELCLEDKLKSMTATSGDMGICIIDVDHFKHYNDDYGHWVGDQVLTAVANALRSHQDRAIDLVARYAGDEFIIILDGVTPGSAELLANRIIKNVAGLRISVPHVEEELKVTISMGIALTTHGNRNSEQLFKNADHALLKAKDMGKNCYAMH
jgi:diguanylate cyclase (GGDEF)-like protein